MMKSPVVPGSNARLSPRANVQMRGATILREPALGDCPFEAREREKRRRPFQSSRCFRTCSSSAWREREEKRKTGTAAAAAGDDARGCKNLVALRPLLAHKLDSSSFECIEGLGGGCRARSGRRGNAVRRRKRQSNATTRTASPERELRKKKKSLDADDADEKDSLSLDVSFPHL